MATRVTAIKLTAVNGKQVRAGLRKLSEAARGEVISDTLWAMGLFVETQAKLNITTWDLIESGNLRASIHPNSPDVDEKAARGSITIGTNVVYAAIHEFGGFIRPRNARMLFWTGKDGKTHAAHVVHMPAKPYLRPAVKDHLPELEQIAATTIMAMIARFGHAR